MKMFYCRFTHFFFKYRKCPTVFVCPFLEPKFSYLIHVQIQYKTEFSYYSHFIVFIIRGSSALKRVVFVFSLYREQGNNFF